MTTSPKHGIDRSLEFAAPLRRLGHPVTLHVAARMVRDRAHLERILDRSAELGIDDFFVIGGDAPEPLGPYASAGELLEVLATHPLRPPSIGIAGYPEGHPLIAPDVLDAALDEKARAADYIVTQLCFDPEPLVEWLEHVRARGVKLPPYVGGAGAGE